MEKSKYWLEIEMQHHCPGCGGEIYGPAVYGFSQGGVACPFCGAVSKKMNTDEYRALLVRRRLLNHRAAILGRLAASRGKP